MVMRKQSPNPWQNIRTVTPAETDPVLFFLGIIYLVNESGFAGMQLRQALSAAGPSEIQFLQRSPGRSADEPALMIQPTLVQNVFVNRIADLKCFQINDERRPAAELKVRVFRRRLFLPNLSVSLVL